MVDTVITGVLDIFFNGTERITKSWKESVQGNFKRVGWRTKYRDRTLDYSDYIIENNTIIFHYHNGKTKTLKANAIIEENNEYVYIFQFGIAVSQYHNCFYVPIWEKGLFCFSLDTGKLIWRNPLKHAGLTMVYRDFLLCGFEGLGVMKMSCETGTELDRMTITTFTTLHQLESPYYFIGPKRNKYYVVDARSFSIVKQIPANKIADDGFLIVEVKGTKDSLIVVGWENEQICERRIDI